MVEIILNSEEFKHDIYSLVKAFFPDEDIQIVLDEQAEDILLKTKDTVICLKDTWSDRTESRKDKKSHMKRELYKLLKDYLKKELPWGTLTGIRPVKIPMVFLEAGMEEAEISSHMKDTYYTSDEKIELAIDIAKRERYVLRNIDYENGYSLYIGIPFCPSICLYCSFSSYAYKQYGHLAEAYLKALYQDIDTIADIFKHKKLNTIYIGGGTPTTLSAEQLDELLLKLKNTFDYSHLKEFTVEAGRPDSITREKLEVLKKYEVSRISINPQSMQQKTLDLIGRKHTIEQTIDAFHMARELGFDNINMDIILGLPGETPGDVENTMLALKALGPDSVTVHSLAIKRAARLNMERNNYHMVTSQEMQQMMQTAYQYADQMNLKPYYLYRQKNIAGNYENVGFAKVDKAGIYNILIMEEKQTIAAAGAGASTKAVILGENRIERVENVKNVEQYIDRIDEMVQRKKEFFAKYPVEYTNDITDVIHEDLERELGHGICVSNLAFRLAKELDLSEEARQELAIAGLLHDIGKLRLSHYLNGHEKAELNVEKMKYVRMHSKLSAEILKEHGYSDKIVEAVLYHHENYDGTGYPENKRNEDIPFYARILRVCDVFAALTSDRRYRSAFEIETAMELMIEEIKNFDMGIFLAFQRVVHEQGIETLLNEKIKL